MSMLVEHDRLVDRVRDVTVWWVSRRMGKLQEELHETMMINPFLIPILFDLHHTESFADLGAVLLSGHLMTGASTGFGKLLDERLLPAVFGTHKLTGPFRAASSPLIESCFDDIDHPVPRPDGPPALLSLKASRWTIQLSAAVGLNRSFSEILDRYPDRYDSIVVGVIYGKTSGLTDKYDILQGINRGKKHDVRDIRKSVQVLAGRDFWSWMNGGESATQDWILEGILAGLQDANCRERCKVLMENYAAAFNRRYANHINADNSVNWPQLLSEING